MLKISFSLNLTTSFYKIVQTNLKCSLNLHLICTKKIANLTLNLGIFDALVLMLLCTKFVPNSTPKRCSSCINLLRIKCKFVPNSTNKVHDLHHLFTASQKMHNCLVGKKLENIIKIWNKFLKDQVNISQGSCRPAVQKT